MSDTDQFKEAGIWSRQPVGAVSHFTQTRAAAEPEGYTEATKSASSDVEEGFSTFAKIHRSLWGVLWIELWRQTNKSDEK